MFETIWKITLNLRPQISTHPYPVFLSYIKPHKPITSQRIAHWIKDVLTEAWVNTEIFKPHSVRGAATTAALKKGISIQDILQTADWSTDSTFRRFYYRPSQENTFVEKISTVLVLSVRFQRPMEWVYELYQSNMQTSTSLLTEVFMYLNEHLPCTYMHV